MNDCEKLVMKNINLLLRRKNDTFSSLREHLSAHISPKKVDVFLQGGEGLDDRILIGLSKYFNTNINFFFENHNELVSDKEEKLQELRNILGIEANDKKKDYDSLLADYTKLALKKELITMSYASYLLGEPIEKIMEIDNE